MAAVLAGAAAAIPFGFAFGPTVTWLVPATLYLSWT